MKTFIFFLLFFMSLNVAAQTPQYVFESPSDTTGTTKTVFHGMLSGVLKKFQTIHFQNNFPGIPATGVITNVYMQVANHIPAGTELYNFMVELGTTTKDSLYLNSSGKYDYFTGTSQTIYPVYTFNTDLDSGDWAKFELSSPYAYQFSEEGMHLVVGTEYDTGNFAPFAGPEVLIQVYNTYRTLISAGSMYNPALYALTFIIGFDLQPTGTEELTEKSAKAILYPNPANNELFVPVAGSYRITDLVGKVVQEGVVSKKNKPVNIASLPIGMYMLRLQGPHNWESFKFIKK